MPTWHILNERQLKNLARARRLRSALLVALGLVGGLMLARPDGMVAVAGATALAPAAAQSPARDWCETANGLRLSCGMRSPQ